MISKTYKFKKINNIYLKLKKMYNCKKATNKNKKNIHQIILLVFLD